VIHSTVDAAYFTDLLALDRLRRDEKDELLLPAGEIITSPYHIAVVEQLRGELLRDLPAPDSLPVDVFISAQGEPTNRATTKMGGLPYWPAREDWPVNEYDSFLTFVGQLCFSDSQDILPPLPGDILLVFADYDQFGDEEAFLTFYWRKQTNEEPINADDLPWSGWKIAPPYGYRHRTVDYVEDLPGASKIRRPYLLARIEGTKIGGMPRWIQYDPELPGQFLGSIGSVHPTWGKPYPFVNHPEPIDLSYAEKSLMWGDAGSLYLSMTPDGVIHWDLQYY